MKKTIKELYTLVGSPFVLDPTVTYPEIEGDTSNFLEDYDTNKEEYDRYFVHEYGDRVVDLEAENEEDAEQEYLEQMKSILMIYLFSWARLYYTLNIPFNPIYNVEEHTTNTYGQHVTDNEYGQDKMTDVYGNKSETIGQRSDSSTSYSVAFDSTLEKETGKTEDSIGSQTNTATSYTDTHTRDEKKDTVTSKEHIDTIDREGNIGVVSATELLIQEERFRRNYSFFKNCFLTMVEELGAYYESCPL